MMIRFLLKFFGPFLIFMFIRSLFSNMTHRQNRQNENQRSSGGWQWTWTPFGGFGTFGGFPGGSEWQQGPFGGQRQQSNQRRTYAAGESADQTSQSAYQSPYDILGLSQSASASEIKTRYRELISKYHPDKFASLDDPEFTKLAADKFQRIQGAYEDLKAAGRV